MKLLTAKWQEKHQLKEGSKLRSAEKDKKGADLVESNGLTDTGKAPPTNEAELRQHEKLILGLGVEGCRAAVAPCVKPTVEQFAVDDEVDWPDCKVGAKLICRWMAEPCTICTICSGGTEEIG